MRRTLLALVAVVITMGLPANNHAEDFVTTALSGLPTQTLRVESSSPEKLRKLSNYKTLREKFLGQRLQQLEATLNQIGIHEDDVNELLIGWKPGDKEMDLYGYAAGRFNKTMVANKAAAEGLTPTPISEQQAYCLTGGVAGTCVVILDNSLGVFGPLSTLAELLDAHSGVAPSLNSDARFTGLLNDVDKDAPIWGIALGGAVGDWFGAWLSTQQNTLNLDWSKVFEKVDSLTYAIDIGDKVNLNVKMNCQTAQDATTLRQVMDGLKMAQQLTWEQQNPNQPNPYSAMNVEVKDKQIDMQVTMPFSQLTLAGGIGTPTN
jgi:hypothetical protein